MDKSKINLPRRSSSRSRHGFIYCIDEFISSGVSLTILYGKNREKINHNAKKDTIETFDGTLKLELLELKSKQIDSGECLALLSGKCVNVVVLYVCVCESEIRKTSKCQTCYFLR